MGHLDDEALTAIPFLLFATSRKGARNINGLQTKYILWRILCVTGQVTLVCGILPFK